MATQRPDWGDDDWSDAGRGGGSPGFGMNGIHNIQAGGRYGPVSSSNYQSNFGDLPIGASQSPAYGDSQQRLPPKNPAAARYDDNMDSRHQQEKYSSPWYRKKRAWAAVALVVIIAVVVPAAVVTTRNKNHENAYPDFTPLNYTQLETYSGESFFDNFNYYIGYDPAHGFVHYVPKEMAAQLNLTSATADSAVLKVDTSVGNTSVPDASTGRFSVRIESKTQYPVGTLFLFDVRHTPYGCGTWPALWLSDPDPAVWPANGEIDVFEAVNQGDRGNTVSLHTSKGCDMSDVKREMTGKALQGDCFNGTNSNAGCGVEATGSGSASTFGAGFNAGGGGVMAVELREAGIRVWSWMRASLPPDVAAAAAGQGQTMPNPGSWGEAFADFPSTDCDIGGHFRNQSIIANIDLCGDLVEATWADSGCASTCSDWVANYPQAFNEAYWEFGAFRVYKAL